MQCSIEPVGNRYSKVSSKYFSPRFVSSPKTGFYACALYFHFFELRLSLWGSKFHDYPSTFSVFFLWDFRSISPEFWFIRRLAKDKSYDLFKTTRTQQCN
ncbi:hypothetical protein ABFS83_03G032900 [Erythranthe nasuta]